MFFWFTSRKARAIVWLVRVRHMLTGRRYRRIPAPGRKPAWQVPLTRNNLKLRLRSAITDEQWLWLSKKGWRKAYLQPDRRRYRVISNRAVRQLLDARKRDMVHDRIEAYEKARLKRLTEMLPNLTSAPRGTEGGLLARIRGSIGLRE
ncbi:MAG: hypothetical protein M3N23_06060 [Pseudomonadota bacterium]|nr:hypothetical protein [Pseudomonadota bacterium]